MECQNGCDPMWMEEDAWGRGKNCTNCGTMGIGAQALKPATRKSPLFAQATEADEGFKAELARKAEEAKIANALAFARYAAMSDEEKAAASEEAAASFVGRDEIWFR